MVEVILLFKFPNIFHEDSKVIGIVLFLRSDVSRPLSSLGFLVNSNVEEGWNNVELEILENDASHEMHEDKIHRNCCLLASLTISKDVSNHLKVTFHPLMYCNGWGSVAQRGRGIMTLRLALEPLTIGITGAPSSFGVSILTRVNSTALRSSMATIMSL